MWKDLCTLTLSLPRAMQKLIRGKVVQWKPYVLVSYATSCRKGIDGEGCGPGMVFAEAFIRMLAEAGIDSFSGLHVPPGTDWEVCRPLPPPFRRNSAPPLPSTHGRTRTCPPPLPLLPYNALYIYLFLHSLHLLLPFYDCTFSPLSPLRPCPPYLPRSHLHFLAATNQSARLAVPRKVFLTKLAGRTAKCVILAVVVTPVRIMPDIAPVPALCVAPRGPPVAVAIPQLRSAPPGLVQVTHLLQGDL